MDDLSSSLTETAADLKDDDFSVVDDKLVSSSSDLVRCGNADTC